LQRGRTFLPLIACWSIGSVLALVAIRSPLPTTQALHSARLVDSAKSFTGATFTPSVAPVVSARLNGADALLGWSSVTASSGTTVGYRVYRTSQNGVVEVCKGGEAPVVVSTSVSCVDRSMQADVAYTFSEQPVLFRDAQPTWSRPLSVASNSLTGPRIYFAGVGPTVSTTGPAIAIPYPTGTQPGDVLVLVAVSGRQTAPGVPSGWTSLASVGLSGTNAIALSIAWRSADSSASLNWTPSANGTGATVRILRYALGNGYSSTPTIATSQVVVSSGASSTAFTPTPDMATNGANAHAVSVVAVRTPDVPSLSASSVFALQDAESSTPGTVGQGLGIAGGQVLAAGKVVSPTWTAPVAAVWVGATFALR